MEVRAGGLARRADVADLVAPVHLHPDDHGDDAEVRVAGLVAVSVVDDDLVAVAVAVEFRQDHLAVAGGIDRRTEGPGHILAAVRLAAAVHGVRPVAEAAGQVDDVGIGQHRRHARHAGEHVARRAGQAAHFIQRLALDVGALGHMVQPAHRPGQRRVLAEQVQLRIAVDAAQTGILHGVRDFSQAVDGPVHLVVPLLDARQGAVVDVQPVGEHFQPRLPRRRAPLEHRGPGKVPVENGRVEPEVQKHESRGDQDGHRQTERLDVTGIFPLFIQQRLGIENVLGHGNAKILIFCKLPTLT